jgi:hypothetical protein
MHILHTFIPKRKQEYVLKLNGIAIDVVARFDDDEFRRRMFD